MSYVRIALDVPLSTLFDYFVAENLNIVVGQRVLVPFARKQVVGVVLEIAESTELAAERIKNIVKVLDDVPPLSADVLKLLRFCSDYYHHPLGMTVMSALPVRMRGSVPLALKKSLVYKLSDTGKALDLEQLPRRKVVQLRLLEALHHDPSLLRF